MAKVGDLFLALGLSIDDKAFNVADHLIEGMTKDLRALALSAAGASMDVNKALGTIGISSDKVALPLNKVWQLTDKFAGVMRKVWKGLALGAAGAAAGAAYAFKGMITETLDLGGKLNDLSESTGVNVELLQELGYAASQSGGSIEDVASTLSTVQRQISAASKGNKGLAKAYRDAGIAIKTKSGSLRSADAVLGDVADKMAKLPNATARSSLAMKLLGRSSVGLIPMLSKGRKGLQEMREEARRLGGVMTADEIGQLDEFGDGVGGLSFALQGLKQRAVLTLLPELKKLLVSLQEWVAKNKALIVEKVVSGLRSLVEVVKALATVVMFALEHWKLFAAVFITTSIASGIMSIIKAITLLSAASTAAGVKVALAWVMAFLPFVAIIATLALVALLAYKFRDKLAGVARAIGRFFVTMGRGIKAVAAGIKNAFVAVFDFFAEKIAWVVDKVEWLANKVKGALGALTQGLPSEMRDYMQQQRAAAQGGSVAPIMGGAPTRVVPPTTNAPVTMQMGDINVTSPTSDPVALGHEVRKQVQSEWSSIATHALAGVGGRKAR